MRTPVSGVGLAVLVLALSSTGCEDGKKAQAAATAAPTPTPTPPPPPKEEPKEEPKSTRPEKIDTALTPERRSKVEAAVPEARGFVEASGIEEKLKANKKLKEKTGGVAAFDRLASGKWVLFVGPIATLTESGFDLGITYTPQIPGDMMGMSRQWFPITFSNVKGYEMSKIKPGQMVVVVAKYDGSQKASAGHELVAAGVW